MRDDVELDCRKTSETLADNASQVSFSGNRGRIVRRLLKLAGRLLLLIVLSLATLTVGAAVQIYLRLSPRLVNVEKLKNFEFRTPTRILADNGELMGEFCSERRYVVPITEIPKPLLDAFEVSKCPFTKDCPPWDVVLTHTIVNSFREIVFSSTDNESLLLPRSCPRRGGLFRKVEDELNCRRIRNGLTKEEILFLYVNQIYLGSGAYGVEAASRTYFDKKVSQLTIAQCALIAGLCHAPSRYSALNNRAKALERRNYVLKLMVDNGKISVAEYDKAVGDDLVTAQTKIVQDKALKNFLDKVRSYVEKKYGPDPLYKGGLIVHTKVNVPLVETSNLTQKSPDFYIKLIVSGRGKLLEYYP